MPWPTHRSDSQQVMFDSNRRCVFALLMRHDFCAFTAYVVSTTYNIEDMIITSYAIEVIDKKSGMRQVTNRS